MYIPQAFSSEPSLQSFFPSQKSSLLIQMASPQASLLSSQSGSSVTSSGFTFFSFVSLSQFVTAHFQSQVCFSRSKASPGGHLIACSPAAVHWMTSRQASFPDFNLKSSPALLSSQSFFSCESVSSSWQRTPVKSRLKAIRLSHTVLDFISDCGCGDPAALLGRLMEGSDTGPLVKTRTEPGLPSLDPSPVPQPASKSLSC